MGKKDLEQLFKETFKEFHEIPEEKVWNSIEDSLDKKKQKKRIIPIWWRLGGVAALLAILFYVINPFDSSNSDGEIIITETEDNTVPFQKDSLIKESEEFKKELQSNNTEDLTESSNENSKDTVEDYETDAEKDAQNSIIRNQSIKIPEQQVTSNTKEKGEALKKKESLKGYSTKDEDRLNVAKNGDQNVASANTEANKGTTVKNKQSDIIGLSNEKKSDAIAAVDKESNKSVLPSDKTQKKILQEEKVLKGATEDEAVAQNDEENEKRSIFEVIEEQEEEVIAENTDGKWSVGPSVAPVYFNATGEGSPIHSNFASNSKSGNVNLSYGLTVAYNVGKRLKVRSGIHRVDFGYDTNEVLFSSSLEGSTNELIDNISYSQTSRNLVLQSKNSSPQAASNDALFELSANESPALDGKMVQQLGYIEVPLELNYALIDKKIGVNLIGGVSSLFLVDNSVLLESEGLVTEVGEANNANSVNFSTNIGVGLNYEFSPKVQLNLEPVFKYQLNTFSETAGAFRPFSVGVYSGVTFKF